MAGFLGLPKDLKNLPDSDRRISDVVNQILAGKTNNISTTAVTLTAGATTTTVTEAPNRIGADTVILFMPTTATAATAMTKVYVSSRSVSAQTFTITHDNTADVDRTFNYVLIG